MPELRKDPITGRWVIIASDRPKRPEDFLKYEAPEMIGKCPFEPGHEEMTPPEILAFRDKETAANKPGWTVRVVPNRHPALRVEGELDRRGEGMFDLMNGIGAHEIIIETPDHDLKLEDQPPEGIAAVLRAYRERSHDLRKDARFKYILIFRNHGEPAGAMLQHPHSQLMAMPVVPKRVQEEINGAKQYFKMRERCVFCDMIREELAARKRVVLENEGFVVLAPFASRFPFETWVLPKKHSGDFAAMDDAAILVCARAFKEALKRTTQVLTDPPYNFVIHTSPLQENEDELHWHAEIIPRLTRVAGFEWGTGFYINPTPPEEAADFLRSAQP